MTEANRRVGGISRFVHAGLADARERFARATAHEPPADDSLVRVVDASAFVRSVARVVDAVYAAARESAVLGAMAAARRQWCRQTGVERTRHTGVVLLVAAMVHLALTSWQGPDAGWLWLVIPGLAIAFGALMVLAPARGFAREAQR